ncbi:uracil-DNA glycosylase [Candidatus Berkelbacteria bacterium]|nr:uracil-DNA glycosylase [Candidatus Berkelbacteria bacterium]
MIAYQSLEDVAAAMRQCRSCGLCTDQTRVVPGEGNARAKVMFIGEAPGFHEDQLGRPFVGAAGEFLEEMLASVNLERKDVFITNMVHARPPGNRDPLPEELDACWPYLAAQIQLLQPKVIVTLGRHSKSKFLPDVGPISIVHGQAFDRPNPATDAPHQWYVALFHPAAGLHKEELKEQIRQDFQVIYKVLAVTQASL